MNNLRTIRIYKTLWYSKKLELKLHDTIKGFNKINFNQLTRIAVQTMKKAHSVNKLIMLFF